MTRTTVDPFALALFGHAITSLADEMALTIYRTSYSGVLKDIMDYSTALCDPQGRLVAQGLTLAGHLGSIPVALKAALARLGGDLHPGDVICMNDPFEGGMHLPDIFVFQPIFVAGVMVAWRRRSATTPTSAAGCPAPTRRTRPRSIRKGCAFRP